MRKNNIRNKELAAKSNIPLRTINNILSGLTENPTFETLKALAKALDCTLDDFIRDEKRREQSYLPDSDLDRIAKAIDSNSDLKLVIEKIQKVNPEDFKLIMKMVSKMIEEENDKEN